MFLAIRDFIEIQANLKATASSIKQNIVKEIVIIDRFEKWENFIVDKAKHSIKNHYDWEKGKIEPQIEIFINK